MRCMIWNWQQQNWPQFSYDCLALKSLDEQFLIESSKLLGASAIIQDDESQQFHIELMGEEALKSSRIEGETLDRESVISSLLCQLGLSPEYSDHRANDKEKGIAALMVNQYQTFDQPLTHNMLFQWHQCIVGDKSYLRDIGRYRTSAEPMQVVSGYVHQFKVHFEAPPSAMVADEMEGFIQWFNDTAKHGATPMSILTRAAIAHLYFVSIHPFEDGNGRIARALSEKVLAMGLGKPALLALSHQIEKNRKTYYQQLESNQKELSIDSWLLFFSQSVVDATIYSQQLIRFIVEKTRLFDRLRGQINQRQERALKRMFDMGIEGFKGGLSADKYMKVTSAIRRTASRDLSKLVLLGALTKTGENKGTRYWLDIGEEFDVERIKHLATTNHPPS